MYTALARHGQAQRMDMTLAERLRLLRQLGGPKLLLPPGPAAAAGGPGQPALAVRAGGTQGPRRQRDLAPLRRVQHVLRVGARPVDGLHLRVLPDRGRHPGAGPGVQVRPGRPEARRCKPGMRLLDVGCGWGGMVMHAAREYGVRALGVTLSEQQAAVGPAGDQGGRAWPDLAEVRHLDYRDVTETGFDAVSSIGLTEHIGKAQLPGYFCVPLRQAQAAGAGCSTTASPGRTTPGRPGGRTGSSTGTCSPTASSRRPAYLMSLMHDAGFEVRHEENLREHYAKTLAGWCANLDEQLGRGRRRGRRGHGAGLAAVHGRLAARLRAQPDPAAPDPRRQARIARRVGHAAAPGLGAAVR